MRFRFLLTILVLVFLISVSVGQVVAAIVSTPSNSLEDNQFLEPTENVQRYAKGELIVKFREEVGGYATDIKTNLDITQRMLGIPSLRDLFEKWEVKSCERVFKGLEREMISENISERELIRRIREKFPRRAARASGPPPDFNLSNVYLLKLPENADIEAAAEEWSRNPHVSYAQPNYFVQLDVVPNDPFYGSSGTWGQPYDDMWGLKIIQAEKAWGEFASTDAIGAGVVVAVVDTGVDYNHPDIAANIWTNPDEIAGNGVDDDRNGFIDDVRGWDFVGANRWAPPDDDPMDGYGHGTHVAGTIAALTNNGIGVSGVSWHSRIMPVKVFDDDGGWTTITILADGIFYAVNEGADVINCSWGPVDNTTPSIPEIENAVNFAHAHGVVLVFSAGNNNENVMLYCPANSENVITVSSFDHNDQKSDFSNWGNRIDVAAPGGDSGFILPNGNIDISRANILSLRAGTTDMFLNYPGYVPGAAVVGTNYYRCLGTSMAAPHVSGLAALLLSKRPGLSNEDVRQIIRSSADDVDAPGWDVNSGYGRINAYRALQMVSGDFTVSVSPASGSVTSGNSKTATVTVTSIKGFNSTVNLDVAFALPTGAAATFSPTTVTPPENGTATSTLTISTSSSTPAGTYTITITGQMADMGVPSLADYGWNDMASSLKVSGSVTLYEEISYGGALKTFTRETRSCTYTINIERLLGDANGDCKISMGDAMWVAKYAVGLNPTPFYPEAADVTGDGQIMVGDAMFIAKWCVGLITKFPASNTAAGTGTTATTGTTDVWFVPGEKTLGLGEKFSTGVHVDSGTSKLGAYQFTITYNQNIITVDTTKGTNGVEPGADGFVAAVNANTPGRLIVNGFDAYGKGPGNDLHVLTVHWKTVGAGTTTLGLTVTDLVDETGITIGTPHGIDGEVTVGVAHAPIYINGNGQFTSANGVTGGTGTASNPYVIQNWAISASSAYGIDIRNTTAYFVVRNCLVEGGGDTYYGIYLDNVKNGRVEGNTCRNDNHGIHLEYSSHDTLVNNTCTNNAGYGIYVYASDHNTVENNTCKYNDDYDWSYGIRVDGSSYNILENNNCSNNWNGICLASSSHDNLINNTCKNNSYFGIYLNSSSNCLLKKNNCSNNAGYGIYMWNSTNNALTNNTCSNNAGYGWSHGIRLDDSSSNDLLFNTCSSNGSCGISLESSSLNTLNGNECSYNAVSGIDLNYSNNNDLAFNTCLSNDFGIYLYSSDYNTIAYNTCSNNHKYDIYVYNSSNNTLSGNTCGSDAGYDWSYSIRLDNSHNNRLANNTCEGNSNGICLASSDNNTLTWNMCRNNAGYDWSYDIRMDNSSHNTLTGNTCGSNGNCIGLWNSSNNNTLTLNRLLSGTGGNAYEDSCGLNYWDRNGKGNYWGDWQPPAHPDGNHDGVVDTARPIAGGSNQDRYPLVLP